MLSLWAQVTTASTWRNSDGIVTSSQNNMLLVQVPKPSLLSSSPSESGKRLKKPLLKEGASEFHKEHLDDCARTHSISGNLVTLASSGRDTTYHTRTLDSVSTTWQPMSTPTREKIVSVKVNEVERVAQFGLERSATTPYLSLLGRVHQGVAQAFTPMILCCNPCGVNESENSNLSVVVYLASERLPASFSLVPLDIPRRVTDAGSVCSRFSNVGNAECHLFKHLRGPKKASLGLDVCGHADSNRPASITGDSSYKLDWVRELTAPNTNTYYWLYLISKGARA
ncbi:hypothetical protein BDV96DRAFT_607723 [Lophiotrema nucula]|uniref:Uncharacterized protein n=1 Tax=Lophiotrema nucula TaxID=690887 RepID=A0A6A5YGL2_9PLEO|nr:hypothetical protein BDV96DRAFT_607723 [Lophiotrema nucula]